jgi:hypothetical protein
MGSVRALAVIATLGLVLSACGSGAGNAVDTATTVEPSDARGVDHEGTVVRAPGVPDLPFADNPDPDQCGIPTRWGENGEAWLTGVWEGELIQPEVLLYDSHQRVSITGKGGHGAAVEIVLYQHNPVLDYYYVTVVGSGENGWVPAPFLS